MEIEMKIANYFHEVSSFISKSYRYKLHILQKIKEKSNLKDKAKIRLNSSLIMQGTVYVLYDKHIITGT
jgi:hypothetical protein